MLNEIERFYLRQQAAQAAGEAIAAKLLRYRVIGISALSDSSGNGTAMVDGEVAPRHARWIEDAGRTAIALFALEAAQKIIANAGAARAALASLPPAAPSVPVALAGGDERDPNWRRKLSRNRHEINRLRHTLVAVREAGSSKTWLEMGPNDPDIQPDDDDADVPIPAPAGWQKRLRPLAKLLQTFHDAVAKEVSAMTDDDLSVLAADCQAATSDNCDSNTFRAARMTLDHCQRTRAARMPVGAGDDEEDEADDDEM